MNKKKDKLPWLERSQIIHRDFPSIDSLSWEKVLSQDIDLMGIIIRDILKHDQEPTGRPGPRPSLDPDKIQNKLVQIRGEDFSLEEFPETVDHLRGNMTLLELSKQSEIGVNDIYRTHGRQKEPTLWIMAEIAAFFKKRPEYFLEYRIITVNNYITRKMLQLPTSSINSFKKLQEL